MAKDKQEGSGAKKYFVGTWHCLWQYVKLLTEKRAAHIYEMLPPDVPLRLFFDIDTKRTVAITPEAFEASVQRVLHTAAQAAQTYIRADLDQGTLTPVVLDATSATKFSRHIVYPKLMLRNMEHVKALAERTRVALGEDGCGLDMAVYTKGRVFRVLGSAKKKQGAVPLRRLDGREFGVESFFETLVSATQDDDFDAPAPLGTVYTVEINGSIAEPDAKRPRTMKSLVPHNDPKLHIFEQRFFTNATGLGRLPDTQVNGTRFVTWHTSGVVCPNKGTAHKSNKTGFQLNTQTWDGWYCCFDPECNLAKWDRQNRRHVVYPGVFKYRHVGVPKSWFRPLETYLEEAAKTFENTRVVKVTYDRNHGKHFGQLRVECAVSPNPCTKHKHKEWHSTVLVLDLKKDGVPSGGWFCGWRHKPHKLKQLRRVKLLLP